MAVTVHVVTPGNSAAAPAVDEAVLDTTPAAPGRPAAGAAIQDIVVELPADDGGAEPFPPMTMTFHTDAPDLAAAVAESADLAYVTSGNPGLEVFQAALRGTTVDRGGLLQSPVPTRGEDWYRDDTQTPRRGRLLKEFAGYRERLPARRGAAEAAVQAAAADRARTRLAVSRAQVVAEARRYLSLSGDPSAAAAVLVGSGPNRLTGPETLGLVGDLIAIANARAALAGVTAVQRRAEREWGREKLAMLADDRARAGVHQTYLTDAQARQLARDLAAIPDSAEVRDAKQRVTDQRESLTRLVAALAANRPLLFRLWDTDVPFLARRLIQQSRGGNIVADRATVSDSDELRDAVLEVLRGTYQAATELNRRIGAEPELVWEFQHLIDDTLSGLYADESDFAARSARDRVRAEKPAAELETWSEWLGYAQLAFALTGAEPVAAAVTVAQIAVGLAAVVVQAFAAARLQLGEDAFLRPSARLGVPPSYSGVVMDAVDVAINVFTFLKFDAKLLRVP